MVLYQVQGTKAELPLDGVHVAARVVGLVAEVQVVQFYVNPSKAKIDCMYELPMDESAAVCGFEVELDDRLLIGEVKEKNEARVEYNAAIARNETAALLEENKPDMFSQKIGNIPPMSRVNIRIIYVTELKVDAETGGAIFVLPTSIAPRYNPQAMNNIPWQRPWRDICLGRRVVYRDDYQRWNGLVETLPWYRWNYYVPQHVINKQNPGAFSITLEVEMPSKILSVESSTHVLHVENVSNLVEDQNKSVASFWNETESMGKDLVITIYREKPFEPSVQLEVAPDGSGCAMLTLVPEFECAPQAVEIIFLVDCSGSMAGQRIEAAQRALNVFLHSLPISCHFNIYRFGDSFQSLFPKSQPYTQHSLDRAEQYVQQVLKADLGGTEILNPLQAIFSQQPASLGCRQLFVLTDGQVTNTEQVIDICRKNASTTRIFSVGIGDEVSRHLVQGMARAATGTAEFIVGKELTSSSGALEAKLINQLKLATLPSITKIDVDWFGGAKQQPSAPILLNQPVSKFFPTGPAQQHPGSMSFTGNQPPINPVHSVGSGRSVLLQNAGSDIQKNGRNQDLYQAPFLPPPLFSGKKFLMFCFFAPNQMNGIAGISLTAEASPSSGELRISIPVTRVTTVGKTIQLLGARALVRDLSEETSHLHWRRAPPMNSSSYSSSFRDFQSFTNWIGAGQTKQDRGSAWELVPINAVSSQMVRAEIVEMGLKFGIMTKETSFVAVERWRDGRSGFQFSATVLPSQAAPIAVMNATSLRSTNSHRRRTGGKSQRKQLATKAARKSAPIICNEQDEDDEDEKEKRSRMVIDLSSLEYGNELACEARGLPAEDFDDEFEKQKRLFSSFPSSRSLALLLSQQRFDGSFELTPMFADQVNKRMEELTSKASLVNSTLGVNLDVSVTVKIWIAIVFLKTLQTEYSTFMDTWELAAGKTRALVLGSLLTLSSVEATKALDDLLSVAA